MHGLLFFSSEPAMQAGGKVGKEKPIPLWLRQVLERLRQGVKTIEELTRAWSDAQWKQAVELCTESNASELQGFLKHCYEQGKASFPDLYIDFAKTVNWKGKPKGSLVEYITRKNSGDNTEDTESKIPEEFVDKVITPQSRKDWMSNESEKVCYNCGTKFTIRIRRHHCRRCGHNFCDTCSPYRLEAKRTGIGAGILPNARVRVCFTCLQMHHQRQQQQQRMRQTNEVYTKHNAKLDSYRRRVERQEAKERQQKRKTTGRLRSNAKSTALSLPIPETGGDVAPLWNSTAAALAVESEEPVVAAAPQKADSIPRGDFTEYAAARRLHEEYLAQRLTQEAGLAEEWAKLLLLLARRAIGDIQLKVPSLLHSCMDGSFCVCLLATFCISQSLIHTFLLF